MWVMRDEKFISGDFDTSYIDEHYSGSATRAHRQVPLEIAIIAASINAMETGGRAAGGTERQGSRWKDIARREGTGQ